MNTANLKKFAQSARRTLMEQVSTHLTQVRSPESAARRQRPKAVAELEKEIQQRGEAAVIEQVAYTWFNRFCALRFMDVNRYTQVGIVSPAEGQIQPEILADAKLGHMDDAMVPTETQRQIQDLLAGRAPSPDPQAEAYQLLLVAACNHYHTAMPFLFERIDDYTELLLPTDLLSENSVLAQTRAALTPDDCQDVEVIGWLYQFYISEKKDQVIGSKQKITPENIPAATQLFTPHWIVRYLVENSLGRLWMLNRPDSRLVEQMDYYIQPEEGAPQSDAPKETESDFLRVNSPEELKICDPACGSGHMLVYAFDLLYAIYEEEGYAPSEIPRLILTQNLYGMEIDERAGALAAFALTMKARGRDRRFFNRSAGNDLRPNICVLRPIAFTEQELEPELERMVQAMPVESEKEQENLRADLLHDLTLFAEADNFGALLRPRLRPTQLDAARAALGETHQLQSGLFIQHAHDRMDQALEQAATLARTYHVVIANPPYMGSNNMNPALKKFAQENYPASKSDLFAMFIERSLELARHNGVVAMITMQSWMFLSSFEKLRNKLLERDTILSMAHLGARAFDTIGGEVVSTTAFVLEKAQRPTYKGGYLRLIDGNSEAEKMDMFQANKPTGTSQQPAAFFRAAAADFKKIPGSPIAYWVSARIRNSFTEATKNVKDLTISDGQTKTGNNALFLRYYWEVAQKYVGSHGRWWHHPKGGSFRKWYGNVEWVIDWSVQARRHYRKDRVARILPEYLWKKPGISWTLITSGPTSFRLLEKEHIFNLAAPSLFFKDETELLLCLGLVNTKYVAYVLKVINPTINMNVGEIRCIPLVDTIEQYRNEIKCLVQKCIEIEKIDWDAYETSWDFADLPLLRPEFRGETLAATYAALRAHWREMTLEMQRLEEENNRIFIDAYGLQDELTPDVPLNEITLTCNPHYRYSGNRSEEELEKLLRADTMREFISYAVGCMFGRYSLEKPGLILANQGETAEDYYAKIAATNNGNGTTAEQDSRDARDSVLFPPDEDNVIPLLDGDWFTDDISERFKRFLRVTFGEEHYEENLAFVEEALGRNIRNYFLREFYSDHLQRYKKRPIYWLFSSPKGSFNALIYMHRYRPHTVSVVLNDYLREFRTKLTARKAHLEAVSISASETQSAKTKALKEIEKLNSVLDELNTYEREVLYPLATQQVEIDLDDGVKVNYNKLGAALKKVSGLSKK